MEEIWKDVVGYETLYQVSNLGRIKRLQKEYTDTYKSGRHRVLPERLLSPSVNKNGYVLVDLHNEQGRVRKYVHRIVAEAFISNPDNLPCVNHKDENKANNQLENLEWCDYYYNNNYGTTRKRMVDTRRANGTYDNISQETRNKISTALSGKPKSLTHRENMRGHNNNRYKTQCRKDG